MVGQSDAVGKLKAVGVRPCYHIFLTVTLSYDSKVNLVGPLDAEK